MNNQYVFKISRKFDSWDATCICEWESAFHIWFQYMNSTTDRGRPIIVSLYDISEQRYVDISSGVAKVTGTGKMFYKNHHSWIKHDLLEGMKVLFEGQYWTISFVYPDNLHVDLVGPINKSRRLVKIERLTLVEN